MNDLKKYKEKFDLVLSILIVISFSLLIYSLLYIYNYYNHNDLLLHFPNNISSKNEKLSPNEIGDSIGGTLNPIIAFTASILTFLAFYIQYKANKSQREIFNLSLENEITKLQKDKKDREIEILNSHNSNLKIFKTLVHSMLEYYENTGEELASFISKEEKEPLKMNSFSFLTNSSYKYLNQMEFKDIYNSIVVYFNENYPNDTWEENFIEVLNYIDYYEKMIIELNDKFQNHINKKYENITLIGENLNRNMGIVFNDEYLSENDSLYPYLEIVHNRKPDDSLVIPEEDFYKSGVDFERLHREFFPKFIHNLKNWYEVNRTQNYFELLEKFSEMNKGLGTEIYQSKNYTDGLKDRYNSYFYTENGKYPLINVKNFIEKINVS